MDSVYSPLPLYTANASGGAVTIRRTAVGAYTVRFDGAANVAGIAMSDVVMVTAYGQPSVQCSTLQWTASNVTDLDVLVRCSDLSGTATNTGFNVALIGSGSLGGKFGFAWTPTTTGGSVNALYSFSTGVAPTHTRSGPGAYSLTFGTGAFTAGSHVLVSTYGAADRGCWVGSWGNGSATSGFQCAQSSDNTLADSRFVALMLEAGRTDKRWAYTWNSDPASALNTAYTPDAAYQRQSNAQSVTVTRTAVGAYTVTFTGLTRAAGQSDIILASAYGNGSFSHCTVPAWSAGGASMTADVRCIDRRTGNAANSYFTIMLLE